MSITVIKTNLGGVLRRISLDTASSTFAQLEERLRVLYGLEPQAKINVSYIDEDGDRIAISTTEEIRDLALAAPKTLKFDINVNDDAAWSDVGRMYPEVPKENGATQDAEVAEVPRSEAVPVEAPREEAVQTETLESKNEKVPGYFEETGVDGSAATQTEAAAQAQAEKGKQPADHKTEATAEETKTSQEHAQPSQEPREQHANEDPLTPIMAAFAALASTVIDEVTKALDRASENISASRPWHGVVCDGCGASPIVGNRWKCQQCPDYDLCGTCFPYQEAIHAGHQFADLGAWGRRGRQRRHGGPRFHGPPPPFFFAPPPPFAAHPGFGPVPPFGGPCGRGSRGSQGQGSGGCC